jgi:DNA polymerase III alpha subunit (gram-positive type)
MFSKDLLLFDIECTGIDFRKHELIQLAAILLDKRTLKQKKSFNSFIRPEHWKSRTSAAMKVNGITWEQVKDAPSLKSVLKDFQKKFGTNAILTQYGGVMDITFMQEAYRKSKMRWGFDYHIFNFWGLFYTYAAKKKVLRNKTRFAGFGLEDLMKHFRISAPPRHDALVDCQVEAEILRRIIKKVRV